MSTTARFHHLLEQAQAGSAAAFAELVSPHRTRIAALVRLRLPTALRRHVSSEDLIQETLMGAFAAIGSLECPNARAFGGWLAQIATNVVRMAARKHIGAQRRDIGREQPLPSTAMRGGGGPVAGQTSAARVLRREERLTRLERALAALTPEHREVIVQARLEGLSLDEIGRRTGRSASAVSSLLFRALRALKREFGETDSLRLPVRRMRLDGGEP